MTQTIGELRRDVFLEPKRGYIKPDDVEKTSYQRGHDDGWNAAVAFYKELGKI